MEIAPLRELKRELNSYSQDELVKICLRLAKHKKEVKELLHYLCFESENQEAYQELVKEEMEEAFEEIAHLTVYKAKTKIRKALRALNKYIRFSGIKATEAELRIHFCQLLTQAEIGVTRSQVLRNIFHRQLTAAHKAIDKLHPDLQFDYEEPIERLANQVPY